jgi:hypothetical protein
MNNSITNQSNDVKLALQKEKDKSLEFNKKLFESLIKPKIIEKEIESNNKSNTTTNEEN